MTLRNKTKQMLVLNLPYQILGSGYMKRQIVGSLTWGHDEKAKGFTKRVRGGNKRISESVRLLGKGRTGANGEPLDTVTGLPPAIERCPDVISALAAKPPQLELVKLDAAQSTKQKLELEKAAKAVQESVEAEKERLAHRQRGYVI